METIAGISKNGIQYILFKVYNRPYCLWGVDLHKRNLEAINDIDSEYFDYLANLYCNQLESEFKQKAAMAIRTAYCHAFETLFSLLIATLQAPHCIYAWMLKYKLGDIANIIKQVRYRNKFNDYLSPAYSIKILSWEDFSMMIHLVHLKKDNNDMAKKFGELWEKLSIDFLDENVRTEYNSIKHGCRAKPGGFSISVGIENFPEEVVPKDKMKFMGGSRFGSSFFIPQEIKGNISGRDHNFKTRKILLNWNVDSVVQRLQLISYSIHNIKSFLTNLNNANVKEITFNCPDSFECFEKVWKGNPGIINGSFDFNIDDTKITKKTYKDIETILDNFKTK